MASPGGRRRGRWLGLLVWFLRLQPLLREAWARVDGELPAPAPDPAPHPASALAPDLTPAPVGGGRQDPRASLWEPPPAGVPGPHGTAVSPPGDSNAYEARAAPQTPAPPKAPEPPSSSSGCGHRAMRIIGGMPASEKKWPWQVSLQVDNEHVCGGSLIASQWVLTAAHCVYGHVDYTVKMGDINLKHTSPMAVQVPVQDIVIHHSFSSFGTIKNDIALALLASPVKYSSHIQPVCFPEKAFLVRAGTECWVTGWGKQNEKDPKDKTPEMLQEAEQSIIRYEKCNEILKEKMDTMSNVVLKGTVCGYSAQGKDSCQGDSGGPLVCDFNETWVQVGIVSWGVGCGRKDHPGVYTEVSFYKDWITDHMSQASRRGSASFLILLPCLALPLGIRTP